MVGYFYMADAAYGKSLASALNLTRGEAEDIFMKKKP